MQISVWNWWSIMSTWIKFTGNDASVRISPTLKCTSITICMSSYSFVVWRSKHGSRPGGLYLGDNLGFSKVCKKQALMDVLRTLWQESQEKYTYVGNRRPWNFLAAKHTLTLSTYVERQANPLKGTKKNRRLLPLFQKIKFFTPRSVKPWMKRSK